MKRSQNRLRIQTITYLAVLNSIKNIILPLILVSFPVTLLAGERHIIELRDFYQTEVKSGGFTLPREMPVHIRALGAGTAKHGKSDDLYAYGWIINADSRDLVWKMDDDNTTTRHNDREFDDEVTLQKGSYEVYFAAYAIESRSPFTSIRMNVDRRNSGVWDEKLKKWGIINWLDEFFDGDIEKDWKKRSKTWGIDLFVDENVSDITMFNPPKDFPNTLFRASRLGENEHINQAFTLSRPISIKVYALGEHSNGDELADFGWIIDARTRKRFWEMKDENTEPAGGAEKNLKFDRAVAFPTGTYILQFITDDSHSYVDWNAAPPSDPLQYGITLVGSSDNDKSAFSLTSAAEDKNVIVQMIKVGNDETRSTSFTLKSDATVRIYALGERGSRREMADYGWIMNAKTREKVWTMDVSHTEHAGGASKNRMVDEAVALPKGTYTVYYQTDGSHSYRKWNSTPPFDPEHWGITITGEGDDFDMKRVEKNVETKEAGVIAQIVRVGNDAKKSVQFRLDRPTRIRVYALGEGESREMFDYGWIEDASSGRIVWEMTYSMTFHAGGGRKNRLVNTTILLDKGEYTLKYASDDSHSFSDWNTDPPDDPTMWGITLYKEE